MQRSHIRELKALTGAHTPVIALCCQHVNQFDGELKAAAARIIALSEHTVQPAAITFRGEQARSEVLNTERGSGPTRNLMFARADQGYDLLLLGGSLYIYPVNWFAGLLAHLSGFLRPRGLLAIRKTSLAVDTQSGLASLDWVLRGLNGEIAREDGHYWYIRPGAAIGAAAPLSLCAWYTQRGLSYLYTQHWWREFEATSTAAKDEDLPGRLRRRGWYLRRAFERRFLLHGGSFDLAALGLADTAGRRVAIATGIRRFIERPLRERDAPHDYEFYRGTFYGLENAGVYSAAKAACILAAIHLSRSRVPPGTQSWHHVDVGSAAGFVPLELLLSRDAGISTVTIVEPFDGYLDLFCDAYLFLRDTLKSGVYYSRSKAEDFDFPKGTGSVSFCGSLLLTDRERVAEVLRRTWDALAPGGTLAVWEHIPTKGEVRTRGADDHRFELGELESLLSALGKVDHWNPSTLALCGPGEHVSGPVFKSLTKPA